MSRRNLSRTTSGVGLLAIVLLANGSVAGQSSSKSLQGVWQVVEVTMAGPGAAVVKPQAALAIIYGRHYSRTYVEQPRPQLPNPATATADELRAAWGPFVSEAGTFELSGENQMTMRPIVAKNPAAMTAGAFVVYTWSMAGNQLTVSPLRTQNGPVANPPTIKLVKVE
jgi:hypothetical protein